MGSSAKLTRYGDHVFLKRIKKGKKGSSEGRKAARTHLKNLKKQSKKAIQQ